MSIDSARFQLHSHLYGFSKAVFQVISEKDFCVYDCLSLIRFFRDQNARCEKKKVSGIRRLIRLAERKDVDSTEYDVRLLGTNS